MKKLVSLNISQIRDVDWKGRTITTGIFKEPVDEKLSVKGVNITGDDQADRSVHGGVDKAIYGYPYEHYSYWEKQYPDKILPFGMFGENMTLQGMLETDVFVGDRIRVGTTELIAVQPCLPCYKLGIRFGTQSILKKFYQADYPGIYYRIAKEGEIQVGDPIEIITRDPSQISIKDIFDILKGQGPLKQLREALQLKYLPNWIKKQMYTVLADH